MSMTKIISELRLKQTRRVRNKTNPGILPQSILPERAGVLSVVESSIGRILIKLE